jgi:uncharacterized membrane protein
VDEVMDMDTDSLRANFAVWQVAIGAVAGVSLGGVVTALLHAPWWAIAAGAVAATVVAVAAELYRIRGTVSGVSRG